MVARKTAVQRTAADRAPEGEPAAQPSGGSGTAEEAEQPDAGQSTSKGAAGAKKAPAKKAPAKKAAKKTAAKKAAAKKSAKKAPAKKGAAKKAAAAEPSAGIETTAAAAGAEPSESSETAGAGAAETTGAETVPAKKSSASPQTGPVPTARTATTGPVAAGDLAVRPGEDPWTETEVQEAREGLHDEVARLREEIDASQEALNGLMRDSGDGAGDDDADTGSKNITREHEMALAANAREMLYQNERALERLDAGTYGVCENCGNPIGKARMQAFPRATLCVDCKQKQERR